MSEWQPIQRTSEVRETCLLYDPAEERIYVGRFEDWYEPEWTDEDGNTLSIVPSHFMPLPAPPVTNPVAAPPPAG